MVKAKKDVKEGSKPNPAPTEIAQDANKAAAKKPAVKKTKPAERVDQPRPENLQYLASWQKQDGSWKFNKKINAWLRTKMLNKALVPDEYFEILLKYLPNSEGNSKRDAFSIAKGIIAEQAKGTTKLDKESLKRAQRIVETLK